MNRRFRFIYTGILCSALSVPILAQDSTSQTPGSANPDPTLPTHQGIGHPGHQETGHSGMLDSFFRQMDLDKDGKVSKSEYEQAFSKFDSNRDGSLSLAELSTAGMQDRRSGQGPSSIDRPTTSQDPAHHQEQPGDATRKTPQDSGPPTDLQDSGSSASPSSNPKPSPDK
jgi:EF hand